MLLYVEAGQCWKMTLIWYAGDAALFRWRHTGSTYTWQHCASIAYDFNLNLLPVCAVNVLLINEHISDHFFKQLCLQVITLWNYDVILKIKCKIRLRNLPTISFCFKLSKNEKVVHEVMYTEYAYLKLRCLRWAVTPNGQSLVYDYLIQTPSGTCARLRFLRNRRWLKNKVFCKGFVTIFSPTLQSHDI